MVIAKNGNLRLLFLFPYSFFDVFSKKHRIDSAYSVMSYHLSRKRVDEGKRKKWWVEVDTLRKKVVLTSAEKLLSSCIIGVH